jgi:predicted nucleic acid-binding protein
VVDASAALSALLNAGPARSALASEQLHAPHLIDSEVANGLRRLVAAEQLAADSGWTALDAFRRLGMTRYPVFSLLDRVWELRDNLSGLPQFVGIFGVSRVRFAWSGAWSGR